MDEPGGERGALASLVEARRRAGWPIGWCSTADEGGMSWGEVDEVTPTGFWVRDIQPLGPRAELAHFVRWGSVFAIDTHEKYARRLVALRGFQPTAPAEGPWRRAAKDRDRLLEAARATGHVVQIRRADGEEPSVLVERVEAGFLIYRAVDVDGSLFDAEAVRLSGLTGVRELDAHAEADTWVLRRRAGAP